MKTLLSISIITTALLSSACTPLPHSSSQQISYSNSYYYLSPQRRELMKIAHQSIGTRYKWGGRTPQEGFDCSGLMQYSYKQIGIKIPRTAAKQRDASRRLSRSQLKPGDMIFFKTGRRSNHVGIYAGNGEFIHASSGSHRVKKERLDTPYWNRHLVKYGTFL